MSSAGEHVSWEAQREDACDGVQYDHTAESNVDVGGDDTDVSRLYTSVLCDVNVRRSGFRLLAGVCTGDKLWYLINSSTSSAGQDQRGGKSYVE